ncbi:MAG: GyrI-like domain-containing protein [Fimbriimonadaceae bacterium]|nr:GyrI-like domain-containing protein [Fimbriimonadaceae bacterium]
MEPRLTAREAFCVWGPTVTVPPDQPGVIPAFWQQLSAAGFFELAHTLRSPTAPVLYGVCGDCDEATGAWVYLAGVELPAGTAAPAGWESIAMPAADYAVFLASGPPQISISATWHEALQEWLPASPYTWAAGHAFEVYDERAVAMDDRFVCEIWIPIQAR